MYAEDTIVAPATAPGIGAVAIVQLSGPRAFEILRSIWRPFTKSSDVRVPIEPRKLALGEVFDRKVAPASAGDSGVVIDEALVATFPRPASCV